MAFGETLTQVESTGGAEVYRIAASANGQKVIVSEIPTQNVYISTDKGTTWTQVASSLFYDLCCSDDFSIIYGATFNDIFTPNVKVKKSTDGGISFSDTGSDDANWALVCCSSNGLIVYAAKYGNAKIYKSTDGGANWSELSSSLSTQYWSIKCSADGQYVVCGDSTDKVYVSDDGGTTWATTTLGVGAVSNRSVALSTSGQYMYAVAESTYFYRSDDYGVSWTEIPTTLDCFRMSCDASGQYIYSVGDIASKNQSSSDYGQTFDSVALSSSLYPYDTLVSQNASVIYMTVGPDGIYAGYPVIISILSITPNVGSTAGGTPVTIVGTGFGVSTTAAIDGNDLTDVTVVDSTTLIGTTPAGTLGSKDVTVTNP